ncbi:MAG: hypothetical protein ACI4PJ_00265 [Acutalibacteraceae bacterium]
MKQAKIEVNGLIQKGQKAISNGEFGQIKKALSEDELENITGGGPLISVLVATNAALIIESFNVFYKHKTGSDKFDIIKLLSMVGWATIALATEFATIKVAQEVYNKIKS